MRLVRQIRTAQLVQGMSVQQLLEKSGLELDRSTLQRKLTGEVPTTDFECEALARALKIQLVYPQKRSRRGGSA